MDFHQRILRQNIAPSVFKTTFDVEKQIEFTEHDAPLLYLEMQVTKTTIVGTQAARGKFINGNFQKPEFTF